MKSNHWYAAVVLTLIALMAACTIESPAPTVTPSVTPLPSATPLPTPLPLLSPAWDGMQVTSLCLDVKENFLNMDKFPNELRQTKAGKFARRLLSHLGFQVLAVGETCQATLTIELMSNALGTTYTLGGYCFSGAKVEGRVQLSSAGLDPIHVIVNEKSPPPRTIVDCPEPDKAPFEKVWYMAVLDGFQILWGPEVLLPAIDSPGDLTDLSIDKVDVMDATFTLLHDKTELGKSLLPFFLGILRDSNQSHDAAALALGDICQDAQVVIPALIDALQDPDAGTRANAAGSLGCYKTEASAVVPALVNALGDKDSEVRWLAALSLEDIGPAALPAVPVLIQALNDKDELVRHEAAIALETIAGEYFGDDPDAWRAWWENNK